MSAATQKKALRIIRAGVSCTLLPCGQWMADIPGERGLYWWALGATRGQALSKLHSRIVRSLTAEANLKER